MPTDCAPVGLADFARPCDVLPLIDDVPGQANEILGPRVCFGEDVDDVPQSLLNLHNEIIVDDLLTSIGSDLAGYEDLAALGSDTVGETARRRPAFRMQ